MKLSQREDKIIELLSQDEETSVSQLSQLLGVSQVTIRADLKNLELKGLIVRVHGSAMSASHPAMRDRQACNLAQKEAIAKAAGAMVSDGDSVMICSGTTPALVARYLLGKKDVNVVTNSTLILPYARVNSGLNITMVGGEFRPQSEALVGSTAVSQLEVFHVSIAFLGTDGLTLEHGMTTMLPESAEIVRCMCHQADRKVLVVDSSKFGAKGFVKILSITDVDVIITDNRFPSEAVKQIRDLGVEVIIAD